jgi:VWFA-related protein
MKLTINRPSRLFVLLMAVAFTTFAVIGCSGGGGSTSDGGNSGSPEILLSTDQLSLGKVVANAAGLRSADRSVQVTNTGTANLVMGQIAKANPLVAPFSIPAGTDNCSGISLAPNASCTVVVRFAPTAPGVFGPDTFDIPSNDLDEPFLTVNVTGIGQGLNVTINKVDTSAYPDVRMIVSVTNGNNDPVTGLLQGDFAVSEGGAGQAIIVDNTVTTAVSVALDLDYSESIIPVQNDVEESAKAFLDTLNPLSDEAAVIKFAREVRTAIPFTPLTPPANLQALKGAIDAPYTGPTDATLLYVAVNDSVEDLSQRANDRLAAIVVSDGLNEPGGFDPNNLDLDSVIQNAQDKKVFIFTIGLAGTFGINTEPMQRMAVETGGQYFEAPNSTALNAIYNQISQILTYQYEITFRTSRPDGTLNSLKVVVTDGGLDGEDTESIVY